MPSVQHQSELTPPLQREYLPWQLWVVIVLLALEGLGNLLSVLSQPIAAWWLGWKVLFVWGLICHSRMVYILFCVMALLHVLAFAVSAPIVALLNLLTVILVITQHRWFFPAASPVVMP